MRRFESYHHFKKKRARLIRRGRRVLLRVIRHASAAAVSPLARGELPRMALGGSMSDPDLIISPLFVYASLHFLLQGSLAMPLDEPTGSRDRL